MLHLEQDHLMQLGFEFMLSVVVLSEAELALEDSVLVGEVLLFLVMI